MRQGKRFVVSDVPVGLAFLPGFDEACLVMDPADRFRAGLAVILAGVEASLW